MHDISTDAIASPAAGGWTYPPWPLTGLRYWLYAPGLSDHELRPQVTVCVGQLAVELCCWRVSLGPGSVGAALGGYVPAGALGLVGL